MVILVVEDTLGSSVHADMLVLVDSLDHVEKLDLQEVKD